MVLITEWTKIVESRAVKKRLSFFRTPVYLGNSTEGYGGGQRLIDAGRSTASRLRAVLVAVLPAPIPTKCLTRRHCMASIPDAPSNSKSFPSVPPEHRNKGISSNEGVV